MFNFQYSPYAIPLGLSAITSVFIILYLYERRHTLAARPSMGTMGALIIWSAGYMFEFLGADIATKIFWAKIQYFGIIGLPFTYFLFALEFSGNRGWLTRKRLLAILAIPMGILLLVLSNEVHRLIWSNWQLETINGDVFLHLEHGFAFWINIAYTYIILIASTVLIIRAVMRRPELYRKQITVILIGVFAPWIGNAISNLGMLAVPLDLTPFGFTITGLALSWGIFRLNFMDIAPIAYETIFENMSEAVIILDSQNIIVDINPAAQKALKASADKIVGKRAGEVFTEQADLLERFRETMSTREEIAIKEGNDVRYYELTISPLINKKELSVGRAIVLHDISERKKASITLVSARDEAIKENQVKSDFLAIISHELRTPLGVIRGYADLISEPSYGTLSELQKKAVSEIIDSTERVSDMVGELLDEARLSAGAVQLESREFSPSEILNDAKAKLSVLAEKKQLVFTTKLDDNLPGQLLGDSTRISQMITNLVTNAIKFTDEGNIEIDFVRKSKTEWSISVSDTGSGIEKKVLDTIFEPFQQADNTITRKHGGTGLGLSIVKHLAELMGGEVNVMSKVSKGSIFTITLPLVLKNPKVYR